MSSLWFPLTFLCTLLLSSRGPWGALSPIPENNAIATDAQVNKSVISSSYSIVARKHDIFVAYYFFKLQIINVLVIIIIILMYS